MRQQANREGEGDEGSQRGGQKDERKASGQKTTRCGRGKENGVASGRYKNRESATTKQKAFCVAKTKLKTTTRRTNRAKQNV